MSQAHPLDRLFDALGCGDIAATADCFTPDAVVWHGFDQAEMTPAQAAEQWEAMVGQFPQRRVEQVRRQETATGCVQQHIWIANTGAGREMAWPVCIVAEIVNGRISRLDEYIDRAGWFVP